MYRAQKQDRSDAMTITSAANPLVKDVRRAIGHGGPTEQGWSIAETFHLLDEALRSGCEVKALIVSESAQPAVETRVGRMACVRTAVLPDSAFQRLAATETCQGVIALVELRQWTSRQVLGEEPLVVVLDRVQDPGNAGAIVRAAEAFGASGAIFLKGTVSPFNPKTLRGAAGS